MYVCMYADGLDVWVNMGALCFSRCYRFAVVVCFYDTLYAHSITIDICLLCRTRLYAP